MGTQTSKKKGTSNTNTVVAEIKRDNDLDANQLALAKTYEGLKWTPRVINLIDFVNVSDTHV